MTEIINPTWTIENFKNLNYKKDYHKDLELVDQYVASGHNKDCITIWNYWEPNPMPKDMEPIQKHFSNLKHLAVAVHKTTPGTYLPLHKDLYTKYNTLFNSEGKFKVVRAIVMLENSVPGQIMQVGNETYGTWQAGQVFRWVDQTLHAIYNFSMTDRYAVQITGLQS